jgi:hypothetical protein
MYFNCQKRKAFALFEEGMRPAEASNMLSLKKRTVYRYFQYWKRKDRIKKRDVELNRLRHLIQKRIKDLDMALDQIRRYPENHNDQEAVKWQRQKRRAEELLINPSLVTVAERKLLLEWYSD